MSQDVQAKQSSLKDILASLRESDSILDNTESKLNYLATNTPSDNPKTESASGESPTLETLNSIAQSIGRKASNIAKHTNTITGN